MALDAGLRRRFGVGNSTGLGLAPFLVNHPMLLNNWIAAREAALARVRDLEVADAEAAARARSTSSAAELARLGEGARRLRPRDYSSVSGFGFGNE